MARAQSATMRAVLKEHCSCELCGSTRGLEAHHIIPITLGGIDSRENILCVCQKCHALLTPHSLLTEIGIANVRDWEKMFWKHFHDISEAGERFDAVDVFDYLDSTLFPIFRRKQLT